MGDSETLTEVPATLKRLAKYIVRGFYGLEHALTLDVLIRYPCVKEEDIATLLQFDKKQLRTVINTLKGDKFIKSRMRVETVANGKSTRHNYYYINYKVLVDVVKYKLDHVRRKIESDERDSTTRASFKCPSCLNTYSDLEVNQLFDPFSALDMPSVTDENDNKEDPNADSEVFRTLLIHESKSTGPGLPPVSKSSRSDSESDTSESEEEKKQTKADACKPTANSDVKPQDDDEEEDEEEEQETLDPTLMVAGQPHLYSEVSQNPQLVSFMTDEERESYIKVGQQMFQSAFE